MSFTPSAIFSPSLARQQLLQAKDWSYIDAWLSAKYSPRPPPPFERNADTLKALLALVALNESADEERDLLAAVEVRALNDLNNIHENDPHHELMGTLEDNLTREGTTALDTLADLSVSLNQAVPDIEDMGRRMIDLSVTTAQQAQTLDRVSILEAHLNDELENINRMITSLQSEDYQAPENMTKQTIDYQRKAKALSAKMPELRDKVKALEAKEGTQKVTIQDVKAEEEKYKDAMRIVKELELQVKGYYGLPQDTDLARLELEGLRVELQDLSRQRDTMFEGLVERESPQKKRS